MGLDGVGVLLYLTSAGSMARAVGKRTSQQDDCVTADEWMRGTCYCYGLPC